MSIRRGWLVLRNAWIYWTKPRHRWNIRQARKVLAKVRTFEHDGQIVAYLKKIDPYVFEEMVVQLFHESGFWVWRTPSYSGDGGVDGKAFHPDTGWCLIQSKRYGRAIRTQHVHDFLGIVGKKRGCFVHSGTSTDAIRAHLKGSPVRMLSGTNLVLCIRKPRVLLRLFSC